MSPGTNCSPQSLSLKGCTASRFLHMNFWDKNHIQIVETFWLRWSSALCSPLLTPFCHNVGCGDAQEAAVEWVFTLPQKHTQTFPPKRGEQFLLVSSEISTTLPVRIMLIEQDPHPHSFRSTERTQELSVLITHYNPVLFKNRLLKAHKENLIETITCNLL